MYFPHSLPLQGVVAYLSIYGHYNIEDEEVRYTHSKDVLSLSQYLMGTHCVLSPFMLWSQLVFHTSSPFSELETETLRVYVTY